LLTLFHSDRDREQLSVDRKTDGLKGSDCAAAAGFDDRTDVGIELGAPFGPEAVCNFAKHCGWPQRPLGTVVGGGNVAIGHEDEHVAADFLDDALEFDAGFMRWLERHQFVEAGVEPCGVGFQRRVGEPGSSLTDAASAAEQMAQFGRKYIVAG